MELERLIEALSRTEAYPYECLSVEVVQTHISAVFLVGDRAYKIKKPLDLGFLDFTTLERRRHFCHEEVRLNRRLAPDVYLGVAPVVETAQGMVVSDDFDQYGDTILDGDGAAPAGVVEYAVVMRRLPDDRTLEALLERDALDAPIIDEVAVRVAQFHAEAASGPEIARWGGWDTVAHNARENFEQIEPSVGLTISRPVFERLRAITESDLERLRPLMEFRADSDVPRDTHGDLHLKHIYRFEDSDPPGDLVIVDCIEFNERFRFADPISDIAFLAMDLRYRGRADLAEHLEGAYLESAGDADGAQLMPYYVGYRAMVRGKVDGFLAAEAEVPQQVRDAAVTRARAYFLLALGVLDEPQRRPALLLSTGLPGTGKSWLARWLVSEHGFRAVATDEVRKRLAGLTPMTDASAPVDRGIYAPEWTERTYAACLSEARDLLMEGGRVVVDGTFREEERRREFLDLAREMRVPAILFVTTAPPDLVRRRLEYRTGTASDADWSVYEALAERWEPHRALTAPATVTLDTSRPEHETLKEATKALEASGLA
jgi:aminoglycoside phosphotransferase family enzyme/predicted kinase